MNCLLLRLHPTWHWQKSNIIRCKTLRTNSGLRAINSCLHLFWPQLCKACWVNIVLWHQNLKIFISPADCGVWTHPHFYTDLRPVSNNLSIPKLQDHSQNHSISIYAYLPCSGTQLFVLLNSKFSYFSGLITTNNIFLKNILFIGIKTRVTCIAARLLPTIQE